MQGQIRRRLPEAGIVQQGAGGAGEEVTVLVVRGGGQQSLAPLAARGAEVRVVTPSGGGGILPVCVLCRGSALRASDGILPACEMCVVGVPL